MKPSELIPLFDEFLFEQNLRLEAVLIGGAALLCKGSFWVVQQDANPDWPAHVETILLDLARRCGHGL